MSGNEKQIHDWQEKLKSSFSEAGGMLHYLISTMDNFYYRYIETEESKNLQTQTLSPQTYGAISFESNLVQALKISNPELKKNLIEFAKSIPKSQNPKIRYQISCEIKELTPDHGHLILVSEISWDFPDFQNDLNKCIQKKINFKYSDLTEFRKKFALKLEECCELFL